MATKLQARSEHPMVPLGLFRPRAAATPVAIGFTFMAGFYGMVFLVSLFFQEQRGLSSFETGLAFLPVTGFSIFMPVVAARMAERFGARIPITIGQAAMPSATSLLLNTVPGERSGTASGVLNTSRQVGGALAIEAFGALIAGLGYDSGLEVSLVIAGVLLVMTMLASLRLRDAGH